MKTLQVVKIGNIYSGIDQIYIFNEQADAIKFVEDLITLDGTRPYENKWIQEEELSWTVIPERCDKIGIDEMTVMD